MVTGKIVQKDAATDLVTPVPVYATVAGKNLLLGRVFVDEAEAPFRFNAPLNTRKVVVDPDQTLLTRVQ